MRNLNEIATTNSEFGCESKNGEFGSIRLDLSILKQRYSYVQKNDYDRWFTDLNYETWLIKQDFDLIGVAADDECKRKIYRNIDRRDMFFGIKTFGLGRLINYLIELYFHFEVKKLERHLSCKKKK